VLAEGGFALHGTQRVEPTLEDVFVSVLARQ
jgi:hypothetical protein